MEEETAQITGGSWETKHIQRAKERQLRTEAGLIETTTIGNTQNEENEAN